MHASVVPARQLGNEIKPRLFTGDDDLLRLDDIVRLDRLPVVAGDAGLEGDEGGEIAVAAKRVNVEMVLLETARPHCPTMVNERRHLTSEFAAKIVFDG